MFPRHDGNYKKPATETSPKNPQNEESLDTF